MSTDTAMEFRGETVKSESAQIEPVKVIARYVSGKVLKGYTHDFFSQQAYIPYFPEYRQSPQRKEQTIQMLDLKALFFVRDFAGDSFVQ